MDDDKYTVGYGRPPKHSQFKKGQSGNPGGRRKKPKDLDALMLKELDEKISVKESGRTRRITKREAITKRIVNAALQGNPRQLEFLFRYMRELGISGDFLMNDDDRDELSSALQELNRRKGSKRDPEAGND